MRVNFVSYRDLYRDTLDLERRLPRDIVGVIGVPRSGMLPASIIALHRNIPLLSIVQPSSPAEDHKVMWLDSGRRHCEYAVGKLLLVDDSIYMGSAMLAAKTIVDEAYPKTGHCTAAVYGSPETPDARKADYIGRIVPANRYFAWNLFHHDDLKNAMLDLDGVVCHDPDITDSVDESAYAAWLPNAEPFNVPTVPIGAICTNRLLRNYDETAAWLQRHRVDYRELFMSTATTPAERSMESIGEFKGRTYRDSRFTLFIESDCRQAFHIARVSGKPVISIDTGEVFQ